MDVRDVVACNAKRIREEKKLTLDGAAELTGVSRSMLAQIEKGDVNPTISVLWKIANGYKVSFTSLLEEKCNEVHVIREADNVPLTEDDGRCVNYPIFTFQEQTLFETFRLILKPGGTLSAQPHLSGSEEYITVFSGEVEITVEEESFRLSRGDSIRFLASVPHVYKNVGPDTVEMSMVIYYHR